MESSKKAVAEACQCLAEVRNLLFTARVHIAMNGEYQDLDESFDVGETFYFEKDHFKDCKDINLVNLYKLIDMIDEVHGSLLNLNGLGPADK